MNNKVVLVTLVLLTGSSLASTPASSAFANGFQILTQLVQNDDDSPILSHLRNLLETIASRTKTPRKGEEGSEENEKQSGIWHSIFRILGFQPTQMPEITFNILTIMTQMVSNSFRHNGKESKRELSKGRSLLEIVLDQPQVSRLLSQMQDPALMDNVLNEVESRMSESSSDCAVQLICRTAPVIRGMQTSLLFFLKQKTFSMESQPPKGETGETDGEDYSKEELHKMNQEWTTRSPLQRFFFFMPTFSDVKTSATLCRKKYPECEL